MICDTLLVDLSRPERLKSTYMCILYLEKNQQYHSGSWNHQQTQRHQKVEGNSSFFWSSVNYRWQEFPPKHTQHRFRHPRFGATEQHNQQLPKPRLQILSGLRIVAISSLNNIVWRKIFNSGCSVTTPYFYQKNYVYVSWKIVRHKFRGFCP